MPVLAPGELYTALLLLVGTLQAAGSDSAQDTPSGGEGEKRQKMNRSGAIRSIYLH